jgi:HEAT repeat protein
MKNIAAELRPSNLQFLERLPAVFALFLFILPISAQIAGGDLSRYRQLLSDGKIEEKRTALFDLRNMRDAEASRVAASALSDRNDMVRATAAASVVFMPGAEAASVLRPLLADRSPFVRREAAYAMALTGDASAAPALASTLKNDRDLEVRSAAAVALGKTGTVETVGPLADALGGVPTEDNELIRRAAARSLGQIAERLRGGHAKGITPENFLPEKFKETDLPPLSPAEAAAFRPAVDALSRVLRSNREAQDTRREAAYAIGAIGDNSARPLLEANLSSADPYMSEICREALLKLR